MSESPDLSLEDELRAAMAQHSEEPDAEVVADAVIPDRDEVGRFTGKEEPVEAADTVEVQEPAAEPDPFAEPPVGVRGAIKDKWAELPSEIRADITAREREVHQGFTRYDEERNFGKQMKSVVAPYEGIIRSLGAEPIQALGYLLKTDAALRTAPPEQRAQMFITAARDYGVDLNALANAAANPAPQPAPEVLALQQQIQRLESSLNNVTTQNREAEDGEITRAIQDFASSAGHEHFEQVKPLMATLLQSGQAATLEEAYDRAVYADPTTRALHLTAQRAEEDRKRTAEATAKAAAKRNASVSVTGAPGSAVPAQTMESSGSLEDDIRNAIRATSSRV